MSVLYLLDTNILVHYVRGSVVWQHVQKVYSPLMTDPRPLISIVSVGELRSLAVQFNWHAARLSQADFICNYFRRVELDDPIILDSYATIDSHTRARGQRMGKNDLWIAATAQALGARILTTDHDFDPIHPAFVERDWIDPSFPPTGGP